MSQLRDDLRRTTEQYREMNQALAQQQQQMTSLQVSYDVQKLTNHKADHSNFIKHILQIRLIWEISWLGLKGLKIPRFTTQISST